MIENKVKLNKIYDFRIIYIIPDSSDLSEILINLIKQIKQTNLINLISSIFPTLKLTRVGRFV